MTLPYRSPEHAEPFPPRAVVQRTAAEREQFTGMFRAHYASVCGYVRRFVQSSAIAEEIAQDVFAQIWEREKSFAYENPRTFLFIAAKRRALNYLRRQQLTARWQADEEAADVPAVESAAGSVEHDDLARVVRQAIDRLPPKTRVVYRLQREANMSYAEIARELGLSIKTVEAQMGRALRLLRVSLAGYLAIVAAVLIGR